MDKKEMKEIIKVCGMLILCGFVFWLPWKFQTTEGKYNWLLYVILSILWIIGLTISGILQWDFNEQNNGRKNRGFGDGKSMYDFKDYVNEKVDEEHKNT